MADEERTGGTPPDPERPVVNRPEGTEPVRTDLAPETSPDGAAGEPASPVVSYEQRTDDAYGYHDDPYYNTDYASPAAPTETTSGDGNALVPAATGGGSSEPPPSSPPDEEDQEDEGMLRMSFLDHLEELRARLIRVVLGLLVAFLASLVFANELWLLVSEPAASALKSLGYDPNLAQITPMDAFTIIYVKLPLLTALFLASPWTLWQVWAFIAPGLYKRERHMAAPFVLTSAGLFILGGVFAYFVAFRFGLTFLLGIGKDLNVKPVVSIVEYFDLFVNVMLGVGLVFELPVLIFFLSLLRLVTPGFLIRNSRYAILLIVLAAALITPTPDVVNLMIFSVPMCLLYFVGVFAAYLLDLSREGRKFPWVFVLGIVLVLFGLAAGTVWLAVAKFGFKLVPTWPYLIR